jgi:demethylmenaquinone methyltransferase / 2-methoxy-6-polyprenyl-1,4-benzoquinol methylase
MTVPPSRHRAETIAQMFSAIADHYDLMNWVMTLGQDQRWRRDAAEAAALSTGMLALDVATGTGDLAVELARKVGPGGHVIGVDFAKAMLDQAQRKFAGRGLPLSFELADALALPYKVDSFDAVTCGFGLRNMSDRLGALREFARVTRPAGRVVILELTPPRNRLARHYMDEVIPRLGQVLARARAAYTYLPESVAEFPNADDLGGLMQEAGLRRVTYRLLNFGTVALHWGESKA